MSMMCDVRVRSGGAVRPVPRRRQDTQSKQVLQPRLRERLIIVRRDRDRPPFAFGGGVPERIEHSRPIRYKTHLILQIRSVL
ncbi:hypothetical protein EVAR_102134_1 [Eumeta japonica]|uniref:Uncharacterized protein n=1 Tax=Eumeta variegata TaxID=151549 RepID=A0A4C1U177_EUMVA|nr:hypothetical protein EVAR_102134_1 [Eumeta japonica]